MITKIIGTLINSILGGYIFETVKSSFINATQDLNLTTAQMTSANLILKQPMFNGYVFAGLILVGGLLIHFTEYQNYLDKGEDIVTTENNNIPHKQTYGEYVKERLMIERMMRE